MVKKVFDFLGNHIDFKFYKVTWLVLFVALSIIPMLMYMPQEFGYENGLIENIQMGTLFVIMYLCLTAKTNINLFRFAALALTLIIIREVNCGRTLFFPIPNEYHKYYSWRDLPWPWLGKIVHAVYATWMAIVGIIFFKKKVHIDLWQTLKNVKIPFWNILFAGFATFMGAIAEKLTNNNFIFEEGFELLFYVSLLSLVWLYSRNQNFNIEK